MYRFAPEYFFEAFGPILGCLKMTAIITLCSMVGVKDMMLQAKMLANKSYRFMEVYLCVLLLYWVINMVFVAIQKVIEQKANDKY